MAERGSQALKLLGVASNLRLFHSRDDEFASIEINDHTETWSLSNPVVSQYLSRLYFQAFADVPNKQSIESALDTLKARAKFDRDLEDVFVRIAHVGDRIYVDLCNEDWQVVEICSDDWRVLDESPIHFIRPLTPVPLPTPQREGSLQDLRYFLNVQWSDFPMAVAWAIGAYMSHGPYPILIINGEQGSTKSTTCSILKSLVDPSQPRLGSPPKDIGDFIIAAKNSWVYSIDNVSHIPAWLSDAICRLSTGGGIVKRKLYTDEDEIVISAQRPTIINGIGDPGTRSDFLDRSIVLTCPTLINRRSEREFWSDWNKSQPKIFGAMLSAVSLAIRHIDNVSSDNLPRMADFARWIMAAAPAIGLTAQQMIECYKSNQRDIHGLAVESSTVATELLRFIERTGEWAGTATELLKLLEKSNGVVRKDYSWPKNGQSLSNILIRMSPNLRAFGVEITRDKFGTGNGRHRIISIKLTESASIVNQRIRASVSFLPKDFIDE